MEGKVVFVGAGPGNPELITVKARNYIEDADVILYAGSLVNPEILKWARKDAELINTAELTTEEVTKIMIEKAKEGKLVVRLKSGDFSIYGALTEELWDLQDAKIKYEFVPGITAALAAASSLGIELTLPKISQTVIITRASGNVPMNGSLKDFAPLIYKGASLVIYTGVHIIDKVVSELREAGVKEDQPIAVVYKATWDEEKIVRGTLSNIAEKVKKEKITRDAVIIVGEIVTPEKYKGKIRSSAYDPNFVTGFRSDKVKDPLKYFELRYKVDKGFGEEYLKYLILALKENINNKDKVRELKEKMEKVLEEAKVNPRLREEAESLLKKL
ncbi:precorrin-4 C(11)-methyltransferase [Acidianus manzaensis]|uniref:Precorrin-4 C(11)-methyltransferase n=1 Tax=Acidianus manzaensis TaxID=282676 RepID=A0A1W6JX54_9CREN|nr:precorrin-4 C(11)-methyltransferase [Acidianus manzaensis]ARM74810.1 precorrin-4 C(11)-methyltransferase [Acidianus manzaensis]